MNAEIFAYAVVDNADIVAVNVVYAESFKPGEFILDFFFVRRINECRSFGKNRTRIGIYDIGIFENFI